MRITDYSILGLSLRSTNKPNVELSGAHRSRQRSSLPCDIRNLSYCAWKVHTTRQSTLELEPKSEMNAGICWPGCFDSTSSGFTNAARQIADATIHLCEPSSLGLRDIASTRLTSDLGG